MQANTTSKKTNGKAACPCPQHELAAKWNAFQEPFYWNFEMNWSRSCLEEQCGCRLGTIHMENSQTSQESDRYSWRRSSQEWSHTSWCRPVNNITVLLKLPPYWLVWKEPTEDISWQYWGLITTGQWKCRGHSAAEKEAAKLAAKSTAFGRWAPSKANLGEVALSFDERDRLQYFSNERKLDSWPARGVGEMGI